MELNLARIVYEHAEPPQNIKPVIEHMQVSIPAPPTGVSDVKSIDAVEQTIAREGYMVQVLA